MPVYHNMPSWAVWMMKISQFQLPDGISYEGITISLVLIGVGAMIYLRNRDA